jgi:crotonobetainyl-CoA:carnitine CoA-transferase CaiB-like acyl-CoA transferase
MTRASRTTGERPLEGVVVLDFTRVLSGPHATRMLVDLGADVIKVEPPAGDLTRFSAPRVNSLSTYFIQQNVGKRNISIDLDRDGASEMVAALMERVDVVVENFRPGVMARLGLDYDTIRPRNERLVYVSITGYGSTGPWQDRRAYAPVVNAETGITKSQGDARGGSYANDPHSHADVYTGMEAATAVIAALYQRERTGRGQYVDVSMAETMLYVNEHAHDRLWDGEPPQGVIRSFQPADYPVLTVADGSVVVGSGHPADRGTFELFVAAMERPDLLEDPRFVDTETRLAHYDELLVPLREWALTCPSSDDIEARLARHRIAVGRLRDVADLAATDWATQRDAVVDISDRGDGRVRIPNSPWHFSESDTSVRGVPKYRGEDNTEVLTSLLGLTSDDIRRLTDNGVIVSRGPGRSTT